MINDKNIIISKDWSLINSYELPYDDNLFFYRDVNNTDSQNLGIYIDEKKSISYKWIFRYLCTKR